MLIPQKIFEFQSKIIIYFTPRFVELVLDFFIKYQGNIIQTKWVEYEAFLCIMMDTIGADRKDATADLSNLKNFMRSLILE